MYQRSKTNDLNQMNSKHVLPVEGGKKSELFLFWNTKIHKII